MQFLVSRVGLAVLENKTLLAFAAQLSRKGEPGAPLQLSQCCDLPSVLPQPCLSHQQGKGTEQPVVMGVVSSCCPGVTVRTLCLSGAHTDIKQQVLVTGQGQVLQDMFCPAFWKLEVILQQALQTYRI